MVFKDIRGFKVIKDIKGVKPSVFSRFAKDALSASKIGSFELRKRLF